MNKPLKCVHTNEGAWQNFPHWCCLLDSEGNRTIFLRSLECKGLGNYENWKTPERGGIGLKGVEEKVMRASNCWQSTYEPYAALSDSKF